MNENEYYRAVFPRLQRTTHGVSHVIAAGRELISHGWNPNGLLVAVEPADQLWKLACEWGLQIHVPVVGAASRRVLMPIDFEISLSHANYQLYYDMHTQHHYFKKYMLPIVDYLENLFIRRELPFLMDLTPSGGHILFWVEQGTAAWSALAGIGFLEEDLKAAYQYRDPRDLKRQSGVDLEAGLVFSGLGRLSEYLGYLAKVALLSDAAPPVTICDSEDKSINYDNSWAGDSAFMRSLRTPFSLHKKNIQRYEMYWQPPLVDVVKTVWDGHCLKRTKGFEYLLTCMWHLDQAARHAEQFDGVIPTASDSLLPLIEAYQRSGLHQFHREYDEHPSLPRGEALERALEVDTIHHNSRRMIENPYPALLQPLNIKKFVADIVVRNRWHPKQVGNLIRDLYQSPEHTWWGGLDWFKSPSETKANYYARLYGGMALWECGRLDLNLNPGQ